MYTYYDYYYSRTSKPNDPKTSREIVCDNKKGLARENEKNHRYEADASRCRRRFGLTVYRRRLTAARGNLIRLFRKLRNGPHRTKRAVDHPGKRDGGEFFRVCLFFSLCFVAITVFIAARWFSRTPHGRCERRHFRDSIGGRRAVTPRAKNPRARLIARRRTGTKGRRVPPPPPPTR